MLGEIGHLSLIIAFVASGCSFYAFLRATKTSTWQKTAHFSFHIHAIAVISSVMALFLIIQQQHYEYHYAWKHSSSTLPLHYIFSCFWEGQEGSFLIWSFWNVVIGWALMRYNNFQKNTTMAIFSVNQFFLLSMILGVYAFNTKIGSSPFILLRDAVNADIFQIDKNFIPADGTGLNPLLQNIWMVIHPPIIFLGFAVAAVPFCMALAALLQRQSSQLLAHLTPWLLISTALLGIGIILGAYWAYETLNFGGYWNWDPVENAVLVPWMIFLASLHGAVLYRRKKKGLALTMMLAMAGYLLVLYSTFLTRSGILGNASVHSFTDLGLSGQLLLFLLSFIGVTIFAFWKNKQELQSADEHADVLSLDFWMTLGISIICLAAFQVLLPTSIPVFNKIIQAVGINKSFAPPADQVSFYSKFQIWFAMGFCLIAATAQLFYWKKFKSLAQLETAIIMPATFALVCTAIIIGFGQTRAISYLLLVFAASYTLCVCTMFIYQLGRQVQNLGGLVAHLGMAIMLIGVVYSAGHQSVLSQNLTINAPDSNLPAHTVQENLLLSRNKSVSSNGFQFKYLGAYRELSDSGDQIPRDMLLETSKAEAFILKEDFAHWHKNDTVTINTENVYYAIQLTNINGANTTIYPRMQNNPTMGYIASPHIYQDFGADVYTHITNFPDPEKVKWNDPQNHVVKMGQSFVQDGLQITLKDIKLTENPAGIPMQKGNVALEAKILVADADNVYEVAPIFHIDNQRRVKLFPDQAAAVGTEITLTNINPETQMYGLSVRTSQREWITIKSIKMPLISFVWVGALVMIIGIGIATYARSLKLVAMDRQQLAPEDYNLRKNTTIHLTIRKEMTLGMEIKPSSKTR